MQESTLRKQYKSELPLETCHVPTGTLAGSAMSGQG